MNISEMVSQNAVKYPRESALIELKPSEGCRHEINWQTFNERVDRFAAALSARGVKKGDRVLHLMFNSINWLEAYFGIIRTGAWVVPLNYRFTGEDIAYCAEIAEAKVMVLGDEFAKRVISVRDKLKMISSFIYVGGDTPKSMENFEQVISNAPLGRPEVTISEDDPCGLYFTSGTTGAPKPILLTHKNMEAAAITEQNHHRQTHEDNFILLPPLYHTGAMMHWLGNLLVGAKATLLMEINPKVIFEAISEEKGTIVWLLVPWAQDILGALDRGELNIENYQLSQWRLMHIGAQPVPASLVRHWKTYFPEMLFDNNYGLSEATGPGCVHLGTENEQREGAIGRPGFNWEARIVNAEGNTAKAGEVGELAVRGGGVMKEYYKNPEKTAESLCDGWLFTGDMAKTDEDGFIYLVDRKKDLVITGGENIFPVEIEEFLYSHPKVYDAAVIGIPDERLGEIAAAVIDPQPGQTLTEAEIAAFCEKHLPRYKRPRKIIFDKVPRNPTGKIEKPKLREKYHTK